MARIWLALVLLLFSIESFSQTITWIWDGVFGYDYAIFNDSIRITSIKRNMSADDAGLMPGDIILSIDSIPCSGVLMSNKDFTDLSNSPGGVPRLFKIYKKESSQTVEILITPETNLAFKPTIYYDFLTKSDKNITFEMIRSDSMQTSFTSFLEGKRTIASVEKNSTSERLGLLPGDRMPGLEYSQKNFWYLEWEFNGFSAEDSIQAIQRGDSTFYINTWENKIEHSEISNIAEASLTNTNLWLRAIYHSNINENRSYLLEIFDDYLDTIYVYHKNRTGKYVESITGNAISLDQRDFVLKNDLLIEIDIQKNETDTLYIKVSDRKNIRFFPLIRLTTLKNVYKYDRIERFASGALLGIILLISCYYFIMFVYLRERTNIIYGLFVLSIGLFLFKASGYSVEYLSSIKKIVYIDEYVLAYLSFILFNLFGISFLNLKTRLRFWYRISLGLAITLSLCLISTIIVDMIPKHHVIWDDIIWYIVWLCIYSTLFLYFIPVVLRIRQGFRPAYHFLISHIILLLLLTMNELFYPGFYSTNLTEVLFSSSIYVGVIIQFLILSLGLAKKMRDTENEKKLAQETLILQLQENERLKDELNKDLEQKVKERTREIELKKQELEEKQQEITDSITYAKRIQTATLPPDSLLEEILPEHFVLFKPRDIVSGDFYWIRQVKNYIIVVAADCTGHGVPGAFMSMLGMSLLNEQVSTRRFDDAGAILNRLRKKVKETLKQEGKVLEQKDGMDLGLAIIDKENMDLQFAGAFNPLYIIRKNENIEKDLISKYKTYAFDDYILIEIKGDRQPLAIHSIEKDFTTNSLQLQSGDTIYLFSDGYPDQIGGPGQKKFMSKNFKKLLLNIQEKNMTEQKDYLERTLSNWKGDVQQVDDIIVFGIRW